jgi:hypothetical protein
LGGGSERVSLDDLGNIGEAIGAVAVVVSLVYLASQIRQNTRAVRATAVDSSIGHSMDVRKSLYESDALARIYTAGSNDPETLSAEDLVRFRMFYHNVLLSLSNIYSQTSLAGLPVETWSAQIPLLQRVLSTAGGKWFWTNYRHEFEPSFRDEVARISADPSTGT